MPISEKTKCKEHYWMLRDHMNKNFRSEKFELSEQQDLYNVREFAKSGFVF